MEEHPARNYQARRDRWQAASLAILYDVRKHDHVEYLGLTQQSAGRLVMSNDGLFELEFD